MLFIFEEKSINDVRLEIAQHLSPNSKVHIFCRFTGFAKMQRISLTQDQSVQPEPVDI